MNLELNEAKVPSQSPGPLTSWFHPNVSISPLDAPSPVQSTASCPGFIPSESAQLLSHLPDCLPYCRLQELSEHESDLTSCSIESFMPSQSSRVEANVFFMWPTSGASSGLSPGNISDFAVLHCVYSSLAHLSARLSLWLLQEFGLPDTPSSTRVCRLGVKPGLLC